MQEEFVKDKSLPETYHEALKTLRREGEPVEYSDYDPIGKEVAMTFVVTEPLAEPMISRCFAGGPVDLEQYRQEMLDGILDWEVERGNWEYTYHGRMANQFDYIIDELQRNPGSRRAVIDLRDPKQDMYNDTQPCLLTIQYLIRNGRLYCKATFRSNDAVKATFMNAFALIMLQKRFADKLGLGMGDYTHRAHSFHCYERDLGVLDGYVKRMIDGGPLTYDYAGDWDEQMKEAKPSIAEKVENLKA